MCKITSHSFTLQGLQFRYTGFLQCVVYFRCVSSQTSQLIKVCEICSVTDLVALGIMACV